MTRHYRVTITKKPIGSAILFKEPSLQGKIITKVTDSKTAGDYKLVLVDCDNRQNEINAAIKGVEELAEAQAVKLAAKFQPKRTVTGSALLQPQKAEKATVAAVDLKKFLKDRTIAGANTSKYYKVSITKRSIGSAVVHKEPAIEGKIIAKVVDSKTAGDYVLLVVDCSDAQNKTNLSLQDVEEQSEAQAVKLAAKFQPRRRVIRSKPPQREEKVAIPALDLNKILKDRILVRT